MTTLREAAEAALDAMTWPLFSSSWEAKHNAAINALRTALEKQAKQDQTRDNLERYTQEIRKVLSGAAKREWQGLTDEEIAAILSQSAGVDLKLNGGDLLFARAIERAHGIGGDE
jgi:hypothetical protein